MPYILKSARKELDPLIDELTLRLLDEYRGNDMLCGKLNYIIFKIAKRLTNTNIGGERSYARFNAIIGALEGCKQEISRRLIAPYEDEKIIENGDV